MTPSRHLPPFAVASILLCLTPQPAFTKTSAANPPAATLHEAFSIDGGKTWEVNWIYDGTRQTQASH